MSFSICFDFLALFQIFWNSDIFQPKENKPNFQNRNVYMDVWGEFRPVVFRPVGSSSKYSRQVAKNTPILREICEANGFNANPIYILYFNVLNAYIPYIFKL